jgi:hypothetical protein
VTHIADSLAYELYPETSPAEPSPCSLLNPEYIAALGVEQEIPAWRELAAQAAQDGEPGG